MNCKNYRSENGQAIVYLVIGLVVFFGFVALAIDGGMALADRRHAQNAADAASLAGGGKAAVSLEQNGITTGNWNCENIDSTLGILDYAETAAINRAKDNNFTITNSAGAPHNYVNAVCNTPGRYIDVTVEISTTTPSNFLQIIYPKALQNEVTAVTRIYAGGPLAYGNAIVALNPETCAGASKTGAGFRGDSKTHVTGGGIFSNGCLTGGGSAVVNVEPPNGIDYNDFFGTDIFTPDAVSVYPEQIPPSSYNVPIPEVSSGQCSDPKAHNISATDLMNLNKNSLTLDPGLWCITGTKDLTINSNSKAPFHANGVTIYIVENINVTINGDSDLQLTAPVDNPSDPNDDPAPAIAGLVIYLPASNNQNLTINGGSNFTITGTLLAPSSHIKINGGTTDIALDSQIIGWDVELIGSSNIDVTYKGGENAHLPTSMELHR